MNSFQCLSSLSPGDVLETDIGGELVRVIVIRVLYPPEIPSEVGMYGVFQFLDANDTSANSEKDAYHLRLASEGYFFAGVENGHEYLEILTGADEHRAVLELAKFDLIRRTRHVTSDEDPMQVNNGLWLVEIAGEWVNCTRSNDIAYGNGDVSAVFISTRRDNDGYLVFVMLDVISEDPLIFRTMTEAEQTDVYARFVSALYTSDAKDVPEHDVREESMYH